MRKALRAAVLLIVLLFAAATVGCGLARFEDSSDQAGAEESVVAPVRAGWVLVLRDGDLSLLAGHWERQVTHTGNYWTGALTTGGSVIGLRRDDGGRSSLVRLEVGESTITQTVEFTLDSELPDGARRSGYLLVSPDAEHVLVGNLVIGLNSGRRTELVPGGCCEVWSPDGSHVAYLARADDWDLDSQPPRRFDLWVADVASEVAPRRLVTGIMDWFDMYGRYAQSIAWSMDGKRVFALSAKGAEWIEKRGPGYEIYGPVNNRLVSVDLESGEEHQLASSLDLQQRLMGGVGDLANGVVVSAAATPRYGGQTAFLAMDYERVYGIGLMNADRRLERLVVETAPGRHTVRMGAPVWSPDGTQLAYFGWYMTSRTPFIDVLDVGTGDIYRVWESTEHRKPGHWDFSPDGEWVWIVVSTNHPDDPRTTRDLSVLASVELPGHVESVPGIILDWCCTTREN